VDFQQSQHFLFKNVLMNNLIFSGLISGMFMSSICVCIAPIMVFITTKNDLPLGFGLKKFKPVNIIIGFITVLYPIWIFLGLFFAFSFELFIMLFDQDIGWVKWGYILFGLLVLFMGLCISYLIKLIFISIRLSIIFFVLFITLFGVAFPLMVLSSN